MAGPNDSPSPLRVFITGASSGIGAALARAYAERAALLGLVARREPVLRDLAESLSTDSLIYACDVRDAQCMREVAQDFMARHGCPDIVIANAGIGYGTLTELPEDYDAFRMVMDVNMTGMVATFQPFVGSMRQRRRGILIGIASVAGYRGLPGAEAYCASKAAAINYLESLRIRLRKDGIRVVTVCPGYVDTPMTKGNPYPMPFIMTARAAARKILKAIDGGGTYTVMPWQMAIVARLLRIVPNWVLDRVLSDVPQKARRHDALQ